MAVALLDIMILSNVDAIDWRGLRIYASMLTFLAHGCHFAPLFPSIYIFSKCPSMSASWRTSMVDLEDT